MEDHSAVCPTHKVKSPFRSLSTLLLHVDLSVGQSNSDLSWKWLYQIISNNARHKLQIYKLPKKINAVNKIKELSKRFAILIVNRNLKGKVSLVTFDIMLMWLIWVGCQLSAKVTVFTWQKIFFALETLYIFRLKWRSLTLECNVEILIRHRWLLPLSNVLIFVTIYLI